ncbi:hypothetical protein [Streptomyces cyaneofuscatus]
MIETMPTLLAQSSNEGMTFKDVATPIIASTTFLFTLGTFWWNNWRRGNLYADHPRSFILKRINGHLLIRAPIILQNSGARTLSVVAMRLRNEEGHVAAFTRLHEAMDLDIKKSTFATGFVIDGRDSKAMVCEFDSSEDDFIKPGTNNFHLDVLFSRRKKWTPNGLIRLSVTSSLLERVDSRNIPFDNSASLPCGLKRSFRI